MPSDFFPTQTELEAAYLRQINYLAAQTLTTDTTLTALGGLELLFIDATAGAVAITLPAATADPRYAPLIIRTDASANAVTVVGTINGVAGPHAIVDQYSGYKLNCAGGAWRTPNTLRP